MDLETSFGVTRFNMGSHSFPPECFLCDRSILLISHKVNYIFGFFVGEYEVNAKGSSYAGIIMIGLLLLIKPASPLRHSSGEPFPIHAAQDTMARFSGGS